MADRSDRLIRIGWREWLALPELGIKRIKAKVDTGARTSTLHTFGLELFHDRGIPMVRFEVHPLQRCSDIVSECCAPVVDQRWVTDSGGHREKRYIINTNVALGPFTWDIEMTLTNRNNMHFRMLLGRTAIIGRFTVDPDTSYELGQHLKPTKHH